MVFHLNSTFKAWSFELFLFLNWNNRMTLKDLPKVEMGLVKKMLLEFKWIQTVRWNMNNRFYPSLCLLLLYRSFTLLLPFCPLSLHYCFCILVCKFADCLPGIFYTRRELHAFLGIVILFLVSECSVANHKCLGHPFEVFFFFFWVIHWRFIIYPSCIFYHGNSEFGT